MTNISRRSVLAGLAGIALTGAVGSTSSARKKASVATAGIAWVNMNWHGYSDDKVVDGKSLRFDPYRCQRAADFFSDTVKASIYAVTECDPEMAALLASDMGSQWKVAGCKDEEQDKNGYLYDSNKYRPITTAQDGYAGWKTYVLPGGGNRRLITSLLLHKESGRILPIAVTHLSSNAPEDRAAQMAEVRRILGSGKWLLMGDLNASSTVATPGVSLAEQGPRVQLNQSGYDTFGDGVGTWHDYDEDRDPLPIDVMALSPGAVKGGMIISGFKVMDTLAPLATDHHLFRATVTF